ncbi:exopolygalacturonase [Phlyctema vagabunda]|uniref:galacturonan 1,4-alpha-galacturonidase n=1 Tax=Phlyctema vagabunda TaxID=108571 RepID=A0ABR4PP77_9HELO
MASTMHKVVALLVVLLACLAQAHSNIRGSALGHWKKPDRHFGPYHHPKPDRRKKVYIRSSKSETDDVSGEFLRGLKKANHGGTLVLPANETFVIGKKLDLTFLNNVQVKLDGEILFTDNDTYWQEEENHFYHPFQRSIMFWKWGGKDIKIYGEGIINGNAQKWWDGAAGTQILDPNNVYLRPVLFYAENTTNLVIEGITFKDPPSWSNFIVTSENVSYDNVLVTAVSTNKNDPKNSDGWDSYNVKGLSVTNSYVNSGDDCFSPKPNTTDIYVKNLYCNGTHGISMGSIGQYPGVQDIIENVWIENVTMVNGQNGARLKAWAGPNVGYGYIKNVTYKDVIIENTDWPVLLDQCYFNINATTCAAYPSNVDFVDIRFLNVRGTSSGKNGRRVASLTCSPQSTCSGIRIEDFDVTSPKGDPPIIVCDYIQGDLGTQCYASNSTEALAAKAAKLKMSKRWSVDLEY